MTQPAQMNPVPALALYEPKFGEPRVDRRIIAKHLDVQHKSTLELIRRYEKRFKRFGVTPFKTAKPPRGSVGGHPEHYILLNENQCYFLLSLSRNTERVVDLKERLIWTFDAVRNRQAIHDAYLPGDHELHDEIALLAQCAKAAGSQTDGTIFHMNFNQLVNKTAGIGSGQRQQLNWLEKLKVTNAQGVAQSALAHALQEGQDHKTAYQRAKAALTRFSQHFLPA